MAMALVVTIIMPMMLKTMMILDKLMRYDDLLDKTELNTYTRTLNARAKQIGIPTRLSMPDVRGVILESGGVCGWCAVSLLRQPFELDHIIPLADKGAHTPQNLVVACPDCNRRKSSQHPAKFAQALSVQLGQTTPLILRVLSHYGITPLFQKPLL